MDRRLHAAKYDPQPPQMPWSRTQFIGDHAPGQPGDEQRRVILPDTYSMYLWHRQARSSRGSHHDPFAFAILMPPWSKHAQSIGLALVLHLPHGHVKPTLHRGYGGRPVDSKRRENFQRLHSSLR